MALILVYHRVIELPTDPCALTVTPRHFDEQMEVLRQRSHIFPLDDFVRGLYGNTLPPRSVAVTLDDGYIDNLTVAKPILERYEIPATVFVTAGYIGANCELWWDELEKILLEPGCLPRKLPLHVANKDWVWDLGDATCYTAEARAVHKTWRFFEDVASPTARHSIFRSLIPQVRRLSPAEREQLLCDMRAWAGTTPAARETYRILSGAELLELANGGLLDVGAHTMTHPSLATMPREEQVGEITSSKLYLEELLRRPVRSFAYPFGQREDFAPLTASIVRDSGFAYACSTLESGAWQSSDRYALPRVPMLDWDGQTFGRWYDEFLKG